MATFDVAVVGGGIMGATSAYYLSKQGLKVLLLDQYNIPNEWSASGDHARSFRLTYGKDLFYTELAVKSLALWKDFQKDIREDFYVPTGMVDVATKDGKYEEACFESLKSMKIPVEKLGPAEIRENYRIFSTRGIKFAVFHPDGGFIWSQRAVTAFSNAASKRLATLRNNVKIAQVLRDKEGIKELRDADGKSWKAQRYVFAPGSWSKELLSAFRLPLTPTRQQILYFRPPRNQGRYRPGHCPVFSSLGKGFYGLPVHVHGFMQIGTSKKGPAEKPSQKPQAVTPQFERSCRQFLKEFIPDLAGFQDTEAKICYYNNTPDGDFIIDRLPNCSNAVVATGFSGHGFKFAPLVGQTVADLITDKKPELNINRFRIARFK